MKNFNFFVLVFIGLIFLSCEKTPKDETPQKAKGVFILNNGSYGGNNANIGVYDVEAKTLTPNAFQVANGQALGELGQDIINFEEDIYIAVCGSQTIFVTNMELKIKKQINAENAAGARLSPRAFAISDARIYVSYYEGYVGEINPNDYSVKLCEVGPNPEGLAIAENKLYVANSGGMNHPDYNNTVSIVSLDTFTEVSTIEVNLNPIEVVSSSDGAYVYVSSYGSYGVTPVKLQAIETSTSKVLDCNYNSISSFAKGDGDILYILCAGFDETGGPIPGEVYKHDMAKNQVLGTFVTDGTELPKAYSISVASAYVYIGSSDYVNTGDVYVFDLKGQLYDKFDSQGINPRVCFSPFK